MRIVSRLLSWLSCGQQPVVKYIPSEYEKQNKEHGDNIIALYHDLKRRGLECPEWLEREYNHVQWFRDLGRAIMGIPDIECEIVKDEVKAE